MLAVTSKHLAFAVLGEVEPGVLSLRSQHRDIVWVVVASIAVDVVDSLALLEWSAELFLGDLAMVVSAMQLDVCAFGVLSAWLLAFAVGEITTAFACLPGVVGLSAGRGAHPLGRLLRLE